MKEPEWYPYDPKDNDRMTAAMAEIPSCFPLLRDSIRTQMSGAWDQITKYNLVWHLQAVYGIDVFNMSFADMAFIEQRIDYWTYAGGDYITTDPTGPDFETVLKKSLETK